MFVFFFFHATMEINFDNDAQNMVDFINKSAREHEVKNERTGRKKIEFYASILFMCL